MSNWREQKRRYVAPFNSNGWRNPVSRVAALLHWERKCAYCGATRKLTLDHIVPRSYGGRNTDGNLTCACKNCNENKGDMSVIDWVRSIKPTEEQVIETVLRINRLRRQKPDRKAAKIALERKPVSTWSRYPPPKKRRGR